MTEYIEREVVMSVVDSVIELYPSEYDAISNKIDQIPAADVVEVVHSKWIKRNNERRCPVCDFFYMTSGTTVYNLCPMCGAKMDGDSNG